MHFGRESSNTLLVELDMTLNMEALGMGYFIDLKLFMTNLFAHPAILHCFIYCMVDFYKSKSKGLLRELNPGPLAP